MGLGRVVLGFGIYGSKIGVAMMYSMVSIVFFMP